MDWPTALTFGLAFFAFAASPGPDNLTILSKTIARGPAHGLVYGAGVICSIVLFVVLAAIGFSAIAQSVNQHLRIVQYGGALYLIYTGIAMLRAKTDVQSRAVGGGLVRLFMTGVLLNLSNPKMPIFYLALLPGVLGVRPLGLHDVVGLLAIIGLVEVVVIGGHVWLGLRARAAMKDRRTIVALNRGGGALMIGAGVLVASR